jgi:glycerol uptake facilitator-like aquaporin
MASALRVHLPLTSPLLLAIGTWMVYVADRILDGLLADASSSLRERHFFYARHRRAFLIAAVPAALLLLWLIVARMNRTARHEDIAIFAVALLYFCLIHTHGPAAERWLPKELAVGIVFAVATAVPAWSRLPGNALASRACLTLMALFFAGLCWLNCVAIEKWERNGDRRPAPHATTQWAQRHFSELSGGLALSAGIFALLATSRGVAAILLASAVTGILLFTLDRQREQFSAFSLRIAADAAMLSPLLFVAMLR